MKNNPGPKLGQILIKHKIITPKQLDLALQEQKRINKKSQRKFKLGEILLFAKFITLPQLQNFLLQQKPRTSEEETKLRELKEKKNPFQIAAWGH